MASDDVAVRVSFVSDEWCSVRMRADFLPSAVTGVDYKHDWRESLMAGVQVCGACGAIRQSQKGNGDGQR